ncbi:OmpA family protein [Verrucomicrobiaceae bacterium R5-34]|uniref:OmpA family protein n=1 Tax=Oceaniferula flava TaxID=2800421 RepID=A0AAE2SD39_9BACT|nr:OmpA family protein [Oceaniferula flavus]MBK1831994.1 OmpA family protein [Verrucomicrobiaceae bacterium R5-34]MBK1854091.1 OmpA family protein [Oceaniferula flavus]MBM1135397.1 OmpA family protein [Oceaniferula flavus]
MKHKTFTVVALLPVLALTSCQTTNPYTGNTQTSKATSGAIIGGLVGAGLGSLTGSGSTDRRQKAMIGAGIGALGGGLIGNYMDKQEAELRAQLQGTGVGVSRNGNDLVLNMPGDITFATNSSTVNSSFTETLNSVAIVLAKYNRTLVNVVGHTDNVGARSYNYALSEKRARSVAGALQSRGVVSQRLLVTGRGPDQPITSNSTASGRQQNRRVTIQLEPYQR